MNLKADEVLQAHFVNCISLRQTANAFLFQIFFKKNLFAILITTL